MGTEGDHGGAAGSVTDDDASASQQVGLLRGEDVRRKCCGAKLETTHALVVTCVSGIGLLTDLFDFNVINIAKLLLQELYGDMTAYQEGMLTGAALIGAVIGQFCFGYVADIIGRRTTFLASALLTLIGALGSACSFPITEDKGSIYTMLIIWRFVMGVGIGGEYPLSAANTAEGVDHKSSGQSLAAVYSMQGVGKMLAPLMFVILLGCGASYELAWRLGFGAGAVLSGIGLVLRSKELKETEDFEEVQARRMQQRLANPEASEDGPGKLSSAWLIPLAGTAVSWFLYDVVDYGLGLYSGDILGADDDPFDAAAAVLAVNAIALPAFFLGIYLVRDDVLGRRDSQVVGFTGMMVIFVILVITEGSVWKETGSGAGRELKFPHGFSYWVFLMLYTTQLVFDASGPGMSTYVIPGEIFPTRMRGTCHGISAASGKIGAVVGSFGFPAMRELTGLGSVMLLNAVVTGVAMFLTFLLTPAYTSTEVGLLKEVARDGGDEAAVVLLYKGPMIREDLRRDGQDAGPATTTSSWMKDCSRRLFMYASPMRVAQAPAEDYVTNVIANELRDSRL
uniref:Major facilitator superfamily (MFS) profile domain-containing protein n=1 Tax=Phaeomonas parva TaxID=124430 RepID=A0A7S1TNM4_9STRA